MTCLSVFLSLTYIFIYFRTKKSWLEYSLVKCCRVFELCYNVEPLSHHFYHFKKAK